MVSDPFPMLGQSPSEVLCNLGNAEQWHSLGLNLGQPFSLNLFYGPLRLHLLALPISSPASGPGVVMYRFLGCTYLWPS